MQLKQHSQTGARLDGLDLISEMDPSATEPPLVKSDGWFAEERRISQPTRPQAKLENVAYTYFEPSLNHCEHRGKLEVEGRVQH